MFRLPFTILWRDDLKDENLKIPCSSLLIALGTTASGKNPFFLCNKSNKNLFSIAFVFTHILCNYDLELIGYGTDEKTTDDGNTETKAFDQIKSQQYSTQSVDRIYRLASTSFVLIQLNSSIKSDRIWPFSEQVLDYFEFFFVILNIN